MPQNPSARSASYFPGRITKYRPSTDSYDGDDCGLWIRHSEHVTTSDQYHTDCVHSQDQCPAPASPKVIRRRASEADIYRKPSWVSNGSQSHLFTAQQHTPTLLRDLVTMTRPKEKMQSTSDDRFKAYPLLAEAIGNQRLSNRMLDYIFPYRPGVPQASKSQVDDVEGKATSNVESPRSVRLESLLLSRNPVNPPSIPNGPGEWHWLQDGIDSVEARRLGYADPIEVTTAREQGILPQGTSPYAGPVVYFVPDNDCHNPDTQPDGSGTWMYLTYKSEKRAAALYSANPTFNPDNVESPSAAQIWQLRNDYRQLGRHFAPEIDLVWVSARYLPATLVNRELARLHRNSNSPASKHISALRRLSLKPLFSDQQVTSKRRIEEVDGGEYPGLKRMHGLIASGAWPLESWFRSSSEAAPPSLESRLSRLELATEHFERRINALQSYSTTNHLDKDWRPVLGTRVIRSLSHSDRAFALQRVAMNLWRVATSLQSAQTTRPPQPARLFHATQPQHVVDELDNAMLEMAEMLRR